MAHLQSIIALNCRQYLPDHTIFSNSCIDYFSVKWCSTLWYRRIACQADVPNSSFMTT